MTIEASFNEIKFTDADVVNPDEFIPDGSYNPHDVRPFLLHDHGFVVAVVFASNLQDALDEAADNNKLDKYQIDPSKNAGDLADYFTTDPAKMVDPLQVHPDYVDDTGKEYWWQITPTYLGNASEPFDIEGLDVVELPNPKFSFAALFNEAATSDGRNGPDRGVGRHHRYADLSRVVPALPCVGVRRQGKDSLSLSR